jgi:RNA polymerase sigma factor (TIGR02999 family)
VSEVSRILSSIHQGDPSAASQLLPLVYDELRKLAAHQLAREKIGQTLQPTALVHEAYMRLVRDAATDGVKDVHWDSRGHFFAAAAIAMRRILVENARKRQSVKHGAGRERFELDDLDLLVKPPPEEILALDEALSRLETEDPEAARIVQLHFFAGQSIEEVAGILGVSRATAYRQWSYARVWLRLAIGGDGDAPDW